MTVSFNVKLVLLASIATYFLARAAAHIVLAPFLESLTRKG